MWAKILYSEGVHNVVSRSTLYENKLIYKVYLKCYVRIHSGNRSCYNMGLYVVAIV